LDNKIKVVTDEIKIAVAETLANFLPKNKLSSERILPSVLDKKIAPTISRRMAKFKTR
jgi:malate dehydrogenase (oxaloacetate-decarboxylating)